MTTCNNLFVYGTLRQNCQNEMSNALAQHAEFIDNAIYQGKLYLIDDYPGVVASKHSSDKVYGEVYWFLKPDILLPLLDDYEECSPDFPAPAEYLRKIQPVTLLNGKTTYAWVYLYTRSTKKLLNIASGDFLKLDLLEMQ